jgi:diguanylate cyclase (GGDEF)-like protein
MSPFSQLLTWFDSRSLFGCQCLLATLFAVVFFWMSRVYPAIRGIRSIAIAFLLGVPSTFLLLARGHISDFLSIVVANLLAAITFTLLYDGVTLFVEGTRKTLWLLAAGLLANAIVYFGSHNLAKTNIVPRIIAMGLFVALARALIAYELLRHSLTARHSNFTVANNRTAMRFLGVVLALTSIAGIVRVVYVAIHGVSQDLLQASLNQSNYPRSPAMLLNVAFLGVFGLSFLLMAGHEMLARSQEESEKDLLSGAFNRRGIESRLATELNRYSRTQHALAVALVDVDHFKAINDLFGHATGDHAIRDVAHTIAANLRDSDYLGRYGGDEFLIVFPLTPARYALVALERLAHAIAAIPLPSGAPPLTLSIGLTEVCLEDDPATAIARADEALYLAKTSGRNRHHTLLPKNLSISQQLPRIPHPRTPIHR